MEGLPPFEVTITVKVTRSTAVPVTVGATLLPGVPLTVIVSDLYLNPDRPLTATQNVDWLLEPFKRGEWLA